MNSLRRPTVNFLGKQILCVVSLFHFKELDTHTQVIQEFHRAEGDEK